MDYNWRKLYDTDTGRVKCFRAGFKSNGKEKQFVDKKPQGIFFLQKRRFYVFKFNWFSFKLKAKLYGVFNKVYCKHV